MGVRYVSLEMYKGRLKVVREIILKDGSAVLQGWTLPPETFSIRAGEYGLDPIDDADVVWDILLNETHLDSEVESPLLTEETLEEAIDKHLTRCRTERDKLESRPGPRHWTEQETADHNAVLQGLREYCPADRQLALLCREDMKNQIKDAKKQKVRKAADPTTPIQSIKRQMIDSIRRREGI